MKRRRRRSQSASISLFPFLAVLICTCGVLIVLLVLAAKSADVEAGKVAEQRADSLQAEIDELTGLVELHQERASGLRSIRDELLDRLNDVLDVRAHLENEIARLNHEAEIVAERWRSLQDGSVEPAQEADLDVQQLRREIAALQERLEREKEKRAAAPPVVYSIVPYHGANAEARYPIYVECTSDGLVIQPYGIEIAETDFVVPIAEDNPLERALFTVRRYFVANGLSESLGTPYPLLVVRPDGAESYALARHAMSGWGDQFGYELVPQDMVLDYGEGDAQLADQLRQAVEDAVRKQRAIRARRATFRQETPATSVAAAGGWRADRRGGFVFHPESDGNQGTHHVHASPQGNAMGRIASDQHSKADSRKSPLSSGEQASANPSGSAGGDGANEQASPGAEPSLAQQRGTGWALPNRTPGAVGYLRPIRVICSQRQLVMRAANGQQVVIEMTGATQDAIDVWVEHVWKIIDSWGVAGTNAYWKPEIRLTVLPGGERRAEELKSLMRGGGWQFEE